MIEFDVETTGLQWYSHELFLVSFQMPNGSVEVHEHDSAKGPNPAIQAVLDSDTQFRAWNSKFDLHFLQAAGYILPDEASWHDGMVLAHIADERVSSALKARAEMLFGSQERDTEKEVHRWILEERKRRRKAAKENDERYVPPTYRDVPEELMRPYAEQDVILTQQVSEVYERILKNDSELAEVYELERRTLAALYAMESRGLPINRADAAAFEAEILSELEPKYERVQQLAGIETFNPGSRNQVEEALKRRGADLTFVTKTPKGALKMDEENLSAVEDELAAAILDWRNSNKMLSTYLHPMLHDSMGDYGIEHAFLTDENRIHPNIRQVGARTARMSSSDPNIQNWHRDDLRLRYLVQADEGKSLVAVDLDAIEMRLFAGFAGEGALLDAIRAGEDIHTMAADAVGLEDFVRVGGHVESARQRGKKWNYAYAYGVGIRGTRKWFRVTQKQAKEMRAAYGARFPEVVALQDTIALALEDRGYVKTPWGRRHRVPLREAYKAVAALVQGTAADLFKESVSRVHEAGIPIVGVYHDEILAEVPTEDAPEAAEFMVRALTEHPRITEVVPLAAEANIVNRWSAAKDADFKPSYTRR